MTLRLGELPGPAVAVFPFLKTREHVRLGSFTFRSTDDVKDLSDEDSARVGEIADMLFLKDDLRIQTATYTLLPSLNLSSDDPTFRELLYIQAIVAYCYSAPRFT